MVSSSPWEKLPLLTLGSRWFFHLSLQLLPLLLSPASFAISGHGRFSFLLLHSKSTRSSSSVHRGLCCSGLAMVDFPAMMEEITMSA